MPANPLDWFERRYAFILDEFQKTFKPTFSDFVYGEGNGNGSN